MLRQRAFCWMVMTIILASGLAARGEARQESGLVLSPSFDCQRAHTTTEMAICGSRVLIELDSKLSEAYYQVLGSAAGTEKEAIRNTQRKWLVRRNKCAGDVSCLEARYEARISELKSDRQLAARPADLASNYAINGIQLGTILDIGNLNTRGYRCSYLDKFSGLTECRQPGTNAEENKVIANLRHETVYIKKTITASRSSVTQLDQEISRISDHVGQKPANVKWSFNKKMLIASWGTINFEQIFNEYERDYAGTDKDVRSGAVLRLTPDTEELGYEDLYRFVNGIGFVYAAKISENGSCLLQYIALNLRVRPKSS